MSGHHTHRSSAANSDDEALALGAAPPQYPTAPPPPYNDDDHSSADEDVPSQQNPGPSRRGRLGSFHEGFINKITGQLASLARSSDAQSTSSEEDIQHDLNKDEVHFLEDLNYHVIVPFRFQPVLNPPKVDLIPAVGDIDAFVKVPRPDEVEDNAGVTQLDEPASKQSDPTIVHMQMKSASKEVTTQENAPVKKLAREDITKEQIDGWIGSVKQLRKNKPAPTVNLKPQMPDVEKLMQELPPEIEKKLEKKEIRLPTAKLDVDLTTFARICCNAADIPIIDDQTIPSLHQLFSVFAQFRNSQHFKNLDHNRAQTSQQPDEAERLEL